MLAEITKNVYFCAVEHKTQVPDMTRRLPTVKDLLPKLSDVLDLLTMDEHEQFYYGKSIAGLKVNQSAQNPITYLFPLEN